ncbi:MAG: hypothetical protein ABI131_03065 [Nostocoides sp.]
MSTTTSRAAARAQQPREDPLAGWLSRARELWPYAACLLALFLAWPSGWAGLAPWWHLPLAIRDGAGLLTGAIASALVVGALVREPWPRFGIAAGVGGLSWLAMSPPAQPQHGRPVLATLLLAGLLVGLGLGALARRGVLGVSTALAVLAGVSPSSWPHTPVLAVAVALPFWLATRQRVAPTLLAVVRAVLAFLVARVLATAFAAGWAAGTKSGLAPVPDLAHRVGSATWNTMWHKGFDIGQTAMTTHTSWVWGGVVLAVWLVVARVVTRRGPRR